MDVSPNSANPIGMACAQPDFRVVGLARLAAAEPAWLDGLPYGVIGFDREGSVNRYNGTEAGFARLDPARVLGRPLFLAVAPCMNNYLIAERFVDEPELDAELDYVLTFRMRPSPVRLRLLQSAAYPVRFVLVRR